MPDRPKYLNLFQIRMPVPALVSILHRVSGAVLFLVLPLLLYWWQQSLSFNGYSALASFFSQWFVKLVLVGLLWAYLHHLFAGIRHLLLDLDIGTDLAQARLTSKLVLAIGITLAVLAGVRLW